LERGCELPTISNVVDPNLVIYNEELEGDGKRDGEMKDDVAGINNYIWEVPPLKLLGVGLDVASTNDSVIFNADNIHKLLHS
jgi:hypothetical protein